MQAYRRLALDGFLQTKKCPAIAGPGTNPITQTYQAGTASAPGASAVIPAVMRLASAQKVRDA